MLRNLFGSLGVGLTYVASTWMAANQHQEVFHVTLIMLAFWMPMAILGPVAGVLVDRYNRRYLLAFSILIRLLSLLSFGVIIETGHYHFAYLFILNVINGTMFSLIMPANGRMIRELVPRSMLLKANASADMVFETGNMTGMALAGLIIGLTSYATTYYINATLFVFAGLSILLIRDNDFLGEVHLSESSYRFRDIGHEYKQSLSYLYHKPQLFWISMVQMLVFLIFVATPALLAPFAKTVLNASVMQFGLIEMSASIGLVAGCFCLAHLVKRWGETAILSLLLLIALASFSAFMLNRTILGAEIIYGIMGFSIASWALSFTQSQNLTHVGYQGRIQSTFASLSSLLAMIIFMGIALVSLVLNNIVWLYLVEIALVFIAFLCLWQYKTVSKNHSELPSR